MSLGIILGFATLAFLSLMALLWSRWPGWFKAILIAGVTGMYFFGYTAVHAIWGMPSTDALPERFVMIAAVVDEPTPKNAGALYLWISELEEGQNTTISPRAYKLPYTRDLHTRIEESLRRGREGVSQMGLATETKRVSKGKGLGVLQPGSEDQEIELRDLPRPELPEK
ncbi:MAG: hypothetical protein ACRBC3_14415 [Burkholderiaceae bacterium]